MKYLIVFFISFFLISCGSKNSIEKQSDKSENISQKQEKQEKQEKQDIKKEEIKKQDIKKEIACKDYFDAAKKEACYLKKLQKTKSKDAVIYISDKYIKQKKYEELFKLLENKLKHIEPKLLREIAYKFKKGHENKRYYKKAYEIYKVAALKDDIFSMSELGYLYANGYGIKKDYKQAYFWFKKASLNSSRYSMSWIGYFFEKGYYVNQDYKEAIKWYKKANTKYSQMRIKAINRKNDLK
ncbi:MAG: tetratricopeptide repeat protein [Campylobacterota bacterium]